MNEEINKTNISKANTEKEKETQIIQKKHIENKRQKSF